MDDVQITNLLIDLNKKVSTLLERSDNQKTMCQERREELDDHETRLKIVEDFIKQEKVFRKIIIGMFLTLSALITWGLDVLSKVGVLLVRIKGGG